ncbi:MAG TPA: efflux RND transporter periplasmic adaptor subunit [Myxococcota bacterium]|nr:efflux RND transporter periplasmic adaptor subunit [Myxococcota bacterium]
MRRALPALAAALLAAALGCGRDKGAVAIAAPPVMVVPVESQRIEDHIEATGQLLARAEAQVASQVQGQVTRIVQDEGAAVAEGQVVLEIDPERRELELRNAQAMLAESEAMLGASQRELERAQKLHDEGVASNAKLDAAETAVRQARSRRESAEAQAGMMERSLRDASVRAPFAGLVARRFVSAGEFVAPGAKLFDLVALDPIEVEFHLPERDSSRIQIGAPVDVRVAPYPDESFRARVTVISPTIDPTTRTLRVKAELGNADGRLRPGLFANADLGIAVRENVALIPAEAVLQRADGSVAFRLGSGGHVERRLIKLGAFHEGRVEVADGLAVGDRVVVRGQDQLIDGAAVSVREADGAPAKVSESSEKTAELRPPGSTPR